MILAEQLLLLFLDDEKGHEQAGWGGDPGLAGALLLDLTRLEAIDEEDGKLVAAEAPRSTIPSSPPPTRRSPPTRSAATPRAGSTASRPSSSRSRSGSPAASSSAAC